MSMVADESQALRELADELGREGVICSCLEDADEIGHTVPDLVLLDADSHAGIRALSRTAIQDLHAPTIILGRLETICGLNGHLFSDDFVVKPYDLRELVLRIRCLMGRSAERNGTELITLGDLSIDTARYEVTIAGRTVVLTFREYELLRFLARNPGRVFTRDALLNHVWGRDYLGGDRTVDVHVRRLRSKIEAFGHSFIETVRNVGYRFHQND